ncbi:O-methyltransferase [Pontibacter silvestris]|uniref:O-methyltransferase n=1 Tax=Pontibacter silvestris TaxID=2305183 RepID=A0ABW4WZZ0_9BACT|nr:class I SAM-dependent methyltransferase [Pontibacter silvestris]MCC9137548.1 class I SAM-dependent methyltransferase [Pontibacter silvestris]
MNTITDNQVIETLQKLHQAAKDDHVSRSQQKQKAAEQGIAFNRSWATAYMAVSPEQGDFLHFLVTVSKAKTIVEFGCSFGISTIYLAAAARDNKGSVITTDLEPNKVAGARKNIDDAGLGDTVTILQGNATQTLSSVDGFIDFLFLDGAKELYLPVLQMLQPKLSKGAIIVADNADHEGARSFVEHLLHAQSEYTSVQLFENRMLAACVK